jgi:hypothetical protein
VAPTPLAGVTQRRLSLVIYLAVIGHTAHAWEAQLAGYIYTLADDDDRLVISYHWHPRGRSHVDWPHLHFGSGARIERADLAGAHLVTGTVVLADFVRMLVEEFAVPPLRPDWESVLSRAAAQ